METIKFYNVDKPYGEFSNFARYPITLDGKRWPTSEHYFQAHKFESDALREEVRALKKASEAAAFGRDRSKPLRSDWEKIKDVVMYKAVHAKFTQHPELRALLLGTGEAYLVEHTTNDSYWADGGDGSGQNRLGQILMQVREALRQADAGRPGDGAETQEPGTEHDDLRRYRHVLLMVHELHRMGYQRLRIAPGMAPSGLYWRCTIAPVSNISRDHGARLVRSEMIARYTSGQKTAYFGWEDAARESPRALAEQFLERFSTLAEQGAGADWAYAGWYMEMLRLTEPGALPIVYADYPLPRDQVPTVGRKPLAPIPLPPPGEAERGRGSA